MVAQRGDVAALAGGDPGRLLAAVLERVEREVGEPGDVVAGRVDAEDPALVARAVAIGARSDGGSHHGAHWQGRAREVRGSLRDPQG